MQNAHFSSDILPLTQYRFKRITAITASGRIRGTERNLNRARIGDLREIERTKRKTRNTSLKKLIPPM